MQFCRFRSHPSPRLRAGADQHSTKALQQLVDLGSGSRTAEAGEDEPLLYVLRAGEKAFQTGWFIESILTQTLVVHVIRSPRMPFIRARASWQLTMTTVAAVAFAVWLTFSPWVVPLGLNGAGLGPVYWGALLAMTVAYVALAHLIARPRLRAA